jgi:mannose-6-phosphate isomerase-like protein (cupin superfamily)
VSVPERFHGPASESSETVQKVIAKRAQALSDEIGPCRGLYSVMGLVGPRRVEGQVTDVATVDVIVTEIDAMEPIHGGLARRARATLGVSAWGMQVLTLPPGWDGYPEHNHDATAFDPNQEEVYIPLSGSATLIAGDKQFELVPGVMARVGPEQQRRLLPGPDGIRFVALGGTPGVFDAPTWTELGAPPPMPQ